VRSQNLLPADSLFPHPHSVCEPVTGFRRELARRRVTPLGGFSMVSTSFPFSQGPLSGFGHFSSPRNFEQGQTSFVVCFRRTSGPSFPLSPRQFDGRYARLLVREFDTPDLPIELSFQEIVAPPFFLPLNFIADRSSLVTYPHAFFSVPPEYPDHQFKVFSAWFLFLFPSSPGPI